MTRRLVRRVSLFASLAVLFCLTFAPSNFQLNTVAKKQPAMPHAGVYFEENRGQHHSRVKYMTRGSGLTTYLTATEAVYILQKPARSKGENVLSEAGRNSQSAIRNLKER